MWCGFITDCVLSVHKLNDVLGNNHKVRNTDFVGLSTLDSLNGAVN